MKKSSAKKRTASAQKASRGYVVVSEYGAPFSYLRDPWSDAAECGLPKSIRVLCYGKYVSWFPSKKEAQAAIDSSRRYAQACPGLTESWRMNLWTVKRDPRRKATQKTAQRRAKHD